MPRNAPGLRRHEEQGFALIELLVVIMLLGVLAAIALPMLLSKQDDGKDATAKSNARNLVSEVASCRVEVDSFADCDSEAELTAANGGPIGLAYGRGDDQVEVESASVDSYTVAARSSSSHKFMIEIDLNAPQKRTCTPRGEGGCGDEGNW